MPFWTLPRKLAGALVLAMALALGWAAVVVAAALAASRDQATSADAIVVLGAAQYNGRPSPVFRARLDHAAALYQRGLAPVVLVTGGVGSGDTVSESDVGRRYLLKAGSPTARSSGCRPGRARQRRWTASPFGSPGKRVVASCSCPTAFTCCASGSSPLGWASCPSRHPPPIPPSGQIRDVTRPTSSPRGSKSPSPGSSTAEGAHAARKPPGLHRPGRAARRRHRAA